VVLLGKRDHWYAIPEVIIAHTQYATPTTLRVTLPDGSARSVRHAEAVPLPDGDDSRRQHLLDLIAQYGATLHALADRLRELGAYADRLAEACGALPGAELSARDLQRAPNPLTPTVIVAPVPPMASARPDVAVDPWQPPTVTRKAAVRHTPKMLVLASATGVPNAPSAQRGNVCCPDDTAWIGCARLVNAAVRAHRALATMLAELGTYPPSRRTAPLVIADT